MRSGAEIAAQARAASDARAWDEAAVLWSRAARAHPNRKDIWVGLAGALREGGRWVEAERVLAGATEQFPNDYDLIVASARNAAAMRDWPRAIARWRDARSIKPDDVAAMYGEAEARCDSGDRTGAETIYERLFEQDADSFWAHWGYARTARVAKDCDAALPSPPCGRGGKRPRRPNSAAGADKRRPWRSGSCIARRRAKMVEWNHLFSILPYELRISTTGGAPIRGVTVNARRIASPPLGISKRAERPSIETATISVFVKGATLITEVSRAFKC